MRCAGVCRALFRSVIGNLGVHIIDVRFENLSFQSRSAGFARFLAPEVDGVATLNEVSLPTGEGMGVVIRREHNGRGAESVRCTPTPREEKRP